MNEHAPESGPPPRVSPLDRQLGPLLVHQGLLVASDLPALHARAEARGDERGGSRLLGGAVAEGLLSAPAADLLLRSLAGDANRGSPDLAAADALIAKALGDAPALPDTLSAAERPTDRLGPPLGLQAPPPLSASGFGASPLPGPAASAGGFGASPLPGPATPGFGASPLPGPAASTPSSGGPVSVSPTVSGGASGFASSPVSAASGATRFDAGPSGAETLDPLFAGERYGALHAERPGWLRSTDARLRRPVVMRVARTPAEHPLVARTARVLAGLDHSVVSQVHDLGERDGLAYFTQDPPEGQSLVDALRARDGDAGLPALLRGFLDLASGVEHAHRRGVVHTRIAPAQVVLGDHGQVWLTGWEHAVLDARASAELRDAAGPPPAADPPAQAAPELQRGGAPDARADVFGLGLVLHWLLAHADPSPGSLAAARRRGAPAALVAIAAKALQPAPTARYRDARQLRDDVARYLDGERVEAQREHVLGALLRVARRHRLAAWIVGVGALAVASTAGLTLLEVRRAYRAAASDHAQADASRAVADGALEDVRARVAQARARRAFLDLLDRAVRLADLQAGAARPDYAAALAAFDEAARALADAPDDERPALQRALRRARADWILERAPPPAPPLSVALEDYRALADETPDDEELQRARLRCARRLSDRAAAVEERAALDALRELGPLGRLIEQVRHAEAQAAADPQRAAALANDAAVGLGELLTSRPDLALAYELRGRAWLTANELEAGIGDLVRATRLDPNDPWPRHDLVTAWVRAYGLHQPWRWEARRFYNHLLAASGLTDRPEPLLALAYQLQSLGLVAQSASFTRRLLEQQERLADPREQVRRLFPTVVLLHARAQLASRQRTPRQLDELTLPADAPARPQRELLLAHDRLVGGDLQAGFTLLSAALEGLRRVGPQDLPLFLADLLRALVDPRVPAEPVLSYVRQVGPQLPAQHPARVMLVVAQLDRLSRLGAPWPQLQPLYASLRQGQAYQLPEVPYRVELAAARAMLAGDPRQPAGHAAALDAWAAVNLFGVNESQLAGVQTLIAGRLVQLGRDDLADELRRPPPGSGGFLDEVWIQRAWVPDALHTPDWLR